MQGRWVFILREKGYISLSALSNFRSAISLFVSQSLFSSEGYTMVYSPATKHPNGARLLALDGGGVRGVMALEVLAEVMDRVRRKKGLTDPCRPADYFELAAGTSTGGIIGIMLFRLRMTAEDAIKQYDVIASQVFSPKVYGWNIGWMPTFLSSTINNSKTLVQSSRFDAASLKKAVDGVVEKFGLDENDRKLKGDAPLQHPGSARM